MSGGKVRWTLADRLWRLHSGARTKRYRAAHGYVCEAFGCKVQRPLYRTSPIGAHFRGRCEHHFFRVARRAGSGTP